MEFSQEKLNQVKELISRYPEGKSKSALLPVLHLAQEEFGGWLSTATMDYVASLMNLKPVEVYEVATFYTMYYLKPVGKYVFSVCQIGPCMVRGSYDIISYIKEILRIGVDQTTSDGLFTLKVVECIGACGYAPMMAMGKHYKEHLTREKIDQNVEECRAEAAAS